MKARASGDGHLTPLGVAWPLLRAVALGGLGYLLGAGAAALLGHTALSGELSVTVGFAVGLVGWLLGGGAWEAWVRSWFGLPPTWDEGTGIARYFRYSTDHKVIGIQYLVTAAFALVAAGLVALLMRAELLTPDLDVFSSKAWYNTAVGIHGSLMIFAVAVVAIVGGFGNYFVPLMIGAEDMTFPYVNGISWWFVLPGVLAILASPLLGGFQTGWTGYEPLAATDESGQILYYLGVFSLGVSSLLTAINVIATTVYMRAPGLTWNRLPVFVWSQLVTAVLNVLWVPVIGVALVMGVMERLLHTNFFSAQGAPLLWQDLFWLFGHPEVYIIMLGAWGIWLEVIPVMARKTLFGYRWAVLGFLAIAFLSGTVWVHHMFASVSAVRWIPFMTTTEAISVPTGFMYLVALGTLWEGRIRLTTPMLFTVFSMLNFLIGGATGIFLADVPSDLQLHDTFFVVGHFHYTIVGGMIFAWLAGMYYWFPKFSGRMHSELWGKINAWWMLVFFNLTFWPMFVAGVEGMNRRVAEYLPYLQPLNAFISVNAFLFGVGFLIPLLNFGISWVRGPRAAANPWGGKTLEWSTSSPPPHGNFASEPLITGDFYSYGEVAPEPDMFRPLRPPAPPHPAAVGPGDE